MFNKGIYDFKIDTKENLRCYSPEEIHLSDNLTEQLINTAKEILQKDKSFFLYLI